MFVHQASGVGGLPADMHFPGSDSCGPLSQSDLHSDGFRSLREGEEVEFKMGVTETGANH